MTFFEAISVCFSKYFVFRGRASRPEFWWFILFLLAIEFICKFIDILRPDIGDVLYVLNRLILIAPTCSVTCRRLHDTNRSGWWQLLWAIPLLGVGAMLVFCTKASQDPNRFDDED